jgi:hypothetical protein
MGRCSGTACADVGRRHFLLGTGSAMAAVGLAGADVAEAGRSQGHATRGPVPMPIPGGLPIGLPPPYDLIHVFLPGPETITLPFSGLPLQGLNVEPTTLTNFSGDTALAFLSGSAMGSDGVEYGLEVDLRVSEGRYSVNGETHRGLFALF